MDLPASGDGGGGGRDSISRPSILTLRDGALTGTAGRGENFTKLEKRYLVKLKNSLEAYVHVQKFYKERLLKRW